MVTKILVNINSGNGLLPDGNQAITWTSDDFSIVKFCGILIRAISQEITQSSTSDISLKSTFLKSNLPGTNDLGCVMHFGQSTGW